MFYRIESDVIEILRVLHGARWKVITDQFGEGA
ncbi:MAG: hypothetical protein GXP16_19235 [Gammaproteobacteria bacterium]|nr:hypothetical protein [Gammaproteobacteria bacterium]